MILKCFLNRFMVLIFVVCVAQTVHAGSHQLKAAERYLEVSLQGLQEQASRLEGRNRELQMGITDSQRALNVLNQKIGIYEKVQSGAIHLSQDLPLGLNKSSLSSAGQRMQRLDRESEYYFQEGQFLQKNYKTQYRGIVEVQAKVSETRLEIQNLKHRLSILSPNQVPERFQQHSAVVAGQLNESQLRIASLSKEMDLAQEMNKGLVQEYMTLNKEKTDIQQKITGLRSEIDILSRQKTALADSWENLNQEDESSLSDLSQEIKRLEVDNDELKTVLNKARKKISRNKIEFNITDDEIELLIENFHIIKNEHERLQSEYESLKMALKGPSAEGVVAQK